MPSPFYGTDATYGLRALLGTSNVSDIDAGFAALRDDVVSKMKGAVPRVTSLPTVGPSGSGALVDGQECYLVADATNGVIWHLRYNSASGSTYKWESVGGSPLRATVDTSETTSGTTLGDLATVGPSVTLPSLPTGGEFIVTVGATITSTANGAGGGEMSFQVGAIGALAADAALMGSTNTPAQGSVTARRKKTISGGTAITAKYAALASTSPLAQFQLRYLEVVPLRVG